MVDYVPPRRIRLDQNAPAELCIREAMHAVEETGAHPLLTEAVVLLGQALDKVADYVDRTPDPAPIPLPAWPPVRSVLDLPQEAVERDAASLAPLIETASPAPIWKPHQDYAGEPMPEGMFRDPPEPGPDASHDNCELPRPGSSAGVDRSGRER